MKQRRLERLSSAVLHDVQATSGGSEPGAILTIYIDWPTVLRVRAPSGQTVGHKYAVPDSLQAAFTSGPEIPLAILKQRVIPRPPNSDSSLNETPKALMRKRPLVVPAHMLPSWSRKRASTSTVARAG